MRTCVVIPTYMEAENIDDVISRVLTHDDIDILVVDDSSPDETSKKVLSWTDKTNGRVQLLSRDKKSGLGRAYLDGFEWCIENGYDILCEMDADLSHDPYVLLELIDPIKSGNFDLVIGSRYVPGGSIPKWSLRRRMLSRGGNLYARFVLGLSVNDATGGYRAFRRELVENLIRNEIRADGYGFQIEMTYLSTLYGARIAEVPIAFSDRIRGESKMSFNVILEAFGLVTWRAIRDRLFKRKKLVPWRQTALEADTINTAKDR